MRIRIVEISIEGFRAIREPLTLALAHPKGGALSRVVLAGPNGSGKTSVLEAILIALGHEELVVRDLPAADRGDHWRVEIPPGAKIVLRCKCVGQPHFVGLGSWSDFVVDRTADRWELRWRDIAGGDNVETEPGKVRELLHEVAIEYFSSWRAPILPGGLQPVTRGGCPPGGNETNRLWRLKQQIINERARRAFERDPSLAKDAQWLRRLNEVWVTFHADGSTIDADIVDPETDDPTFDLFVFDGPTRRCSIDQVSSGELELVTMAGTLLLCGFDGLLLVDEPELHLHREWQTQLVDTLMAMAPQAQLFMATHADAPWDQVYSFERFFLARRGDLRSSAGTSAPSQRRSDGRTHTARWSPTQGGAQGRPRQVSPSHPGQR
jgi:energy-coupling factor transporter ATP-binding protein EcfA2